jgi:transposase
MAVAHASVVSAFHRLSRREPDHELEPTYVDEHRREYLVEQLTQRLECLGYRAGLELLPAA